MDANALLSRIDAEAAELERLPLGSDAVSRALHTGLREAITVRREVHGDPRPQHIYPGDTPVFLDRLTFRHQLRLMDPAEELAFLALDCERLGAARVGERFFAAYRRITHDDVAAPLVACYRVRRALPWAWLSGSHLQRGAPEQPWRGIACNYLRLGLASLAMIDSKSPFDGGERRQGRWRAGKFRCRLNRRAPRSANHLR